MDKECANCGIGLGVPVGRSGGVPAAVAWMNSCRPCADLAAEMMELEEDRPGGAKIQIWRCRVCGSRRACQPGWRTRCHACLDERTVLDGAALDGLAEELRDHLDSELTAILRDGLDLGPNEWVDDVGAFQLFSALDVDDEMAFYDRPGWTLVAGDLKGLPWGWTDAPHSHGVWGRHVACGTLQNVRRLAECAVCDPEPGSRTHRARADRQQLLYLVSFDHPRLGPVLKYGHGDRDRLKAHITGGAEPVCVLQAKHHTVVAAERTLRRQHRGVAIGPIAGLPSSFGRGREVVPASVDVALHDGLFDTGGDLVTSQFLRRRPVVT